jgi:hypothetical protein
MSLTASAIDKRKRKNQRNMADRIEKAVCLAGRSQPGPPIVLFHPP